MGRYCPPCCKNCAFDASGKPVDLDRSKVTVVVPQADYDCKLSGGSEIVTVDDTLGALRPNGFHPITDAGREFHRSNGSPLARYC